MGQDFDWVADVVKYQEHDASRHPFPEQVCPKLSHASVQPVSHRAVLDLQVSPRIAGSVRPSIQPVSHPADQSALCNLGEVSAAAHAFTELLAPLIHLPCHLTACMLKPLQPFVNQIYQR